jgi:parvulin-like peptidyl-prolyl isomerase
MTGRLFLMRIRFLLPLFLLVLAAGCGGGGGSSVKLTTSDVAAVGDRHISKASFNELMHEAQLNMKAQGQTFPKAGTSEYSTIKSQAVTLLVQEAEKEVEAAKLGVKVTPAEIEQRLKAVKKQYFKGDEKKYLAQLKKQGLTDQEVRNNVKSQIIGKKLYDKVTKDTKVIPTQVLAYYAQHKTEFEKAASRDVHYILLGKNKSALATTLHGQLNGAPDATWCTLAKKYSKDSSSSGNCGKATFTKGQTVPEFDKLVFSLPTKNVATVNTKQYGWFVLQPTAAATRATTTPIAKATKQIEQTLLQTKKNDVMTSWIAKIQKDYCKGSKISYQTGYKPSPDPCAQTSTTTTTASPGP